jgi:hypothetical protein
MGQERAWQSHQHQQRVRFCDRIKPDVDRQEHQGDAATALGTDESAQQTAISWSSAAWSLSDHPLLSILAAAAVSVGLYFVDPWISVPCPILSQLLAHS